MYLLDKIKLPDNTRMCCVPTPMEDTEVIEIWASSFNDPGPDYCEFRFLDSQGRVLGTKRQEGY
jgi:hypothetical protein